MSQRSLYWFTNDLRVSDNPLLLQAAQQSVELTCCYVVAPLTQTEQRFQVVANEGGAKERFLLQSLSDVDASLQQRGQSLHIKAGKRFSVLSEWLELTQATHLYLSDSVDYAILATLARLRQRYPHLVIVTSNTHRLFEISQLPFELAQLPTTFSAFRKQIEALGLPTCLASYHSADKLTFMPASKVVESCSYFTQRWQRLETKQIPDTGFHGGESSALRHLKHYFSGDTALSYKSTRNALDDWQASTKFSPWLANGSLSVQRLLLTLKHYEVERGANESTYWIYFELLWREYFQWYALKHGSKLFQFAGIKGQKPLTSYYPQRMRSWINGTTPYPIVNAAMKQLKATGYISNRARQLVASCFVHELSLDWRYGAQYFQSQLIDFDVASNWGNWQYLAGVGADPRGHRQFDLAKQSQLYDADQAFTHRWQGQTGSLLMDSLDMVDWPVE